MINIDNEIERIIVFVDDIDRLPNEQMRMIFKLIGSIANFPKFEYVLSYDEVDDKTINKNRNYDALIDIKDELIELMYQGDNKLLDCDEGKK